MVVVAMVVLVVMKSVEVIDRGKWLLISNLYRWGWKWWWWCFWY